MGHPRQWNRAEQDKATVAWSWSNCAREIKLLGKENPGVLKNPKVIAVRTCHQNLFLTFGLRFTSPSNQCKLIYLYTRGLCAHWVSIQTVVNEARKCDTPAWTQGNYPKYFGHKMKKTQALAAEEKHSETKRRECSGKNSVLPQFCNWWEAAWRTTWRVKLCHKLFYGAEGAEREETPRTCLFNLGPIQWVVLSSCTTQQGKPPPTNHSFLFSRFVCSKFK